jgi:hypothetical protein
MQLLTLDYGDIQYGKLRGGLERARGAAGSGQRKKEEKKEIIFGAPNDIQNKIR